MAEQGQWKESISLEETNKIRVSLGLKPIPDPATAAGSDARLDGDALAEDNYAKRREAEQKEKDAQALKDRLDRARNQKERQRKLVGRGLGAEDAEEARVKREEDEAPDGEDSRAWVKRQKKRAKELAAKRAREQEEEDRLAEQEERNRATKYGEDDLAGLKVAHGAEAFEEGEEVVLTLKDSRILDDEDDELHNVNLSEYAKTKHAADLKKKGRQAGQYTGYDDDEFEGGPGSSRAVLSKYDEDFDAIKVDGFRLGAGGPSGKGKGRAVDAAGRDDTGEREKIKLSMDYTKTFNTDYLQEGEPGFKKPKKKKKRAMRTTTMGDDDEGAAQAMDVDGATPSAPRRIERVSLDETNLIDDDDLQAALARQRRDAAKQKIKEMKARAAAAAAAPANGAGVMDEDGVVKKEADDEDAVTSLSRAAGPTEEGDDEGDVLVLDDTSEFVRNISLAATAANERAQREAEKQERMKREESAAAAAAAGAASVLRRVKAEEVDVPLTELDAAAPPSGWGPAREDGEEDEPMYDGEDDGGAAANGAVDEVKPDLKAENEDDDSLATTGHEGLVSRGLASTLSLLRHQGLVKPRTPEEIAREKEFKEREAWLAAQRRRAEERERERLESRRLGDKKDQQQREHDNRMREQRDAQASLEAFANYKPVVNLTYHDEFGRDLTPKEAWKQLNYDFHGHGSGSKKTDKRLKKIENERKQAAMGAGDTPLSTAAAFAARAEMTGSATMVLGVGNNNSAPLGQNMLGGNGPQIGKSARGTGKGKSGVAGSPGPSSTSAGRNGNGQGAQTVINDIPMRPLPLPSGRDASGTPEPARRGFAPVRSFSPATATAGGGGESGGAGTPGPSGGAKLSIAVKRKAGDEGEGSPASKRRA